jgi:hypothetical protein
MKRLCALLALVGAVAFGAPAWAEEKVAAPEAAVAQVAAAVPGAARRLLHPPLRRLWWLTRAIRPGSWFVPLWLS